MEVPLGKQDRLPVMAHCLRTLAHAVRGNEHSLDAAICISRNDLSRRGFGRNAPPPSRLRGISPAIARFLLLQRAPVCDCPSRFHKVSRITQARTFDVNELIPLNQKH